MSGKSGPDVRLVDATALAAAADCLRSGGLVAVPTETVYGLAARADSESAVASIYRAKGRPDFNPLIVHVPSLEAADQFAVFDARARKLAEAFWPGPLTLVLPLREGTGITPAVTAGLPTIALRCPAHPAMRALLEISGLPLAAPSANRSGGVSPTTAEHVAASLGSRVDMVLDGGACKAGIESTIVAPRDFGWSILRPGPINEAEISAVIGPAGDGMTSTGKIEAPGQLASHYAPGKPVRLGATQARDDEYLIGFGTVAGHTNLSEAGDLAEAAARLYACLHLAATDTRPRVAVAPVPEEGIGAAINDRLRRAAA
ncbi:L-threonylcarbamoyladenylate synthase [Novosphingobium sp.]|uniref:L-threonylcarbamoyladenylate synthase n=1 Tax=Novosphingobium sp. TaxID=1874826 RepID=UPI00286E547A|nr:L-threonylcarbamoyladenylate synthase [Novosphingobium sp.]